MTNPTNLNGDNTMTNPTNLNGDNTVTNPSNTFGSTLAEALQADRPKVDREALRKEVISCIDNGYDPTPSLTQFYGLTLDEPEVLVSRVVLAEMVREIGGLLMSAKELSKRGSNPSLMEQMARAAQELAEVPSPEREALNNTSLDDWEEPENEIGTGKRSTFERFIEIGKAYFVFTPTFYYIGVASSCDASGLSLLDAVWVGHTGALDKMVSGGSLGSAIPFKKSCYIPHSTINTILPWTYALPTSTVARS